MNEKYEYWIEGLFKTQILKVTCQSIGSGSFWRRGTSESLHRKENLWEISS